jgi:hypothetical protein
VEISPLGQALACYDWSRQAGKPGLEEAVREWAADQAREPQEGSGGIYPKGAGVRRPGRQAAKDLLALECAQNGEGGGKATGPAYWERLAAAEAAALGLRLRLELTQGYGAGQTARSETPQPIDFWI